jgi:UDPglucose 6-dehydrogenase
MENCKSIFENITYCDDAYATAEGADALVLATEWNEFRALNFDRIRKAMKAANLIDLRNVYDPQRMRNLGFYYTSVGRAADTSTLKGRR